MKNELNAVFQFMDINVRLKMKTKWLKMKANLVWHWLPADPLPSAVLHLV